MLEFYIKEGNSFVKKDIIIPAILNTTFDETLDSANVVLKYNKVATPYTPDTKCYFKDNNGIFSNMIVVSDEVSRISHKERIYQHSLQLVQNTRLLQKHLVRNSSFSQPRDKYKKQWTSYVSWTRLDVSGKVNKVDVISFNYNEKVLKQGNTVPIRVELNMYGGKWKESLPYPTSNPKFSDCQYYYGGSEITEDKWQDISSAVSIVLRATVTYTDNTTTVTDLQIDADEYINKEYKIFANINDKEIKSINVDIYFNENISKIRIQTNNQEGVQLPNYESNFNIYAYVETYTWTMYDVLHILREQYFLETSRRLFGEDEKTEILFGLPGDNTTFGKILRNTIAPNFVFTSATMYECLAEIFKYYDAIFTLDENNILGIEYLNEYNRKKIESSFSNKMATFSEENFTTGYISYFESALVEENFSCGARGDILGVVENDNWFLILPYNIDTITKIEFYLPQTISDTAVVGTYDYAPRWVDATRWVLPENLFSLLPKETTSLYDKQTFDLLQTNTFPYSGNKITIGGQITRWIITQSHLKLFMENLGRAYTDPEETVSVINLNYQNVKVRIKYITKLDGRLRIENSETKYNGEMIVNQGQGAVDLNKLGLNMLGLSYKLGQPTLSATQEITKWNDNKKIVKGQILEHNGDNYIANIVNYKFYNDHIISNIDFIKDYNALSSRIQVDRQKRLSQISNELAVKSEDNLCEYVYVSSIYRSDIRRDIIYIDTNCFNESILNIFGSSTMVSGEPFKVDFAMITPFKNGHYEESITRYNRWTDTIVNVERVYIPMVKYASGNSVCFEMSFNSPITAGNKTHFTDLNAGYTDNAIYTENGWFDSVNIYFCQYKNAFNDEFPYIAYNNYTVVGQINKLYFYKKPNEIFSLNYELIFLENPDMSKTEFIGNELIKNFGILTDKKNITKFILYYSNTELYSPFDLEGVGNSVNITNIGYSTSADDKLILTFTHGALINNAVSWSICDQNGKIYFASNTTKASGSSTTNLYFTTRIDRI